MVTADWIPDHELARHGGLALDPLTRGPLVDMARRTSRPGVARHRRPAARCGPLPPGRSLSLGVEWLEHVRPGDGDVEVLLR